MKNNNAGKIIGGFLAGAGIITYLLASKDGNKIAEKAGEEAKKILNTAEDKTTEVKEKANGFADQIMDFVVSNRPMIENAVYALINTVTKKK